MNHSITINRAHYTVCARELRAAGDALVNVYPRMGGRVETARAADVRRAMERAASQAR